MQKLTHPRIAFDPAYGHRLFGADLRLGRNIADCRLHDSLFAQRGQDLCDVAQEGPTRAEDEHAVTTELRVVVQQEGGPVEPDRRLARARATLHGQELMERAPG